MKKRFFSLFIIFVATTTSFAQIAKSETTSFKTGTSATTPAAATVDNAKKQEDPVAPKQKECQKIEEQRSADCATKNPKLKDATGSYQCAGGKLKAEFRLTTETSTAEKKAVSCVSGKQINDKTKNPACSNKDICKSGVTRMPNASEITKGQADKAGIKCFYEDPKDKKYVTICNDDQKKFSDMSKQNNVNFYCSESFVGQYGSDQCNTEKKAQNAQQNTPSQQNNPACSDVDIMNGRCGGAAKSPLLQNASQGSATPSSKPESSIPAKKTDIGDTVTDQGKITTGKEKSEKFLTSNEAGAPQTQVADRQVKSDPGQTTQVREATVQPQQDKFQTGNTIAQEGGAGKFVTNQTGAVPGQNGQGTPQTNIGEQYRPQQSQNDWRSEGETSRPMQQRNNENRYESNNRQDNTGRKNNYSTPSQPVATQKVASNSLFDSIFNRPKEPQANVTTNAQIVPWYWQNNYLKPQATKPAATRVSDQTDQQKATTSIDLTTNGAPTTSLKPSGLVSVADARDTSAVPMTPEEEAQARFLKSILEAPSVEEVMKRGGYDYTKLQEAAKEKALADAVAQKDTTQPEQKPTTSILTSIRKSAETLTGKGDSKTEQEKPVLAYASDNQQNVKQQTTSNDPEERQRVVLESIFAQQLKTGELAPKTDGKGIVQVNQTAVQIEKVEVALEVVYKMLKNMTTQLTNSQKSPLTASERDKMANQLFSLSDYLQGSTFNADQPTAEMMNAVAQQLEIAANRAAENASAETILSSLRAALSELALEQQSKKDGVVAVGASMPTAVADWTPEHFAAFKKMITDSLNAAKNPVAIKMYRDALSRISTAELFKQSNQAYWDSQADLVEAQTKIALARSLERSSSAYPSMDMQTESKILPKKPESPLAFVTGQQKPGDGEEAFVTTDDASFVAMGSDADMPEPPETAPQSETKGIIRSLIDWIFGW